MDVNDWEPRTIDHWISPHSEIIQQALSAFWHDRQEDRNPRFGPTFIYGPPSLGKRLAAEIIARELGIESREVMISAMWRSSDLAALLNDAQNQEAASLIVCESAFLPPGIQDVIYYAVRHGVLNIRGAMNGVKTIPFDARRCPLFMIYRQADLSERLLGQCSLVLKFDKYSEDHMTQIISQRMTALRWDLADEALPKIIGYAKGSPGVAMRMLNVARIMSRADDRGSIRTSDVNKAWQHLRNNWPNIRNNTKSKAK